MANDNNLSSKITIDVADAKANLAALNREAKLLDTEFKATAAGINDWGNTVEGNKAKQKQLTETMEVQRKKIENLNALYQDAVTKHGENSKAAQDLKIKLNNEQAALNAAGVELQKVNTKLETLETNADSAGTEVDNLGTDLDGTTQDMKEEGQEADSLSGKLKTGLRVAALAAAAAIAAVGAAAVSAAKKSYSWATEVGQMADDTLTLATQTGISAEKLQEWAYASQFVDTEVSTITGSMAKMVSNMGKAANGSDNAADKFNKLGVNIYNTDGTLRNSEDVFWDAIDALGKMDNETERDAAAMDLFGKSAQDLNPLIEAGRDEFDKFGQEAKDMGLVLTDDQLILAGGFNDAQNKFKSSLQALRQNIGLIAIPAFNRLLTTATNTMSGVSAILADGLQEGDIEAIGEQVSTGVSSILTDVSSIVTAVTPYFLDILTQLVDVACTALPTIMPVLIEAAVKSLVTIAEHLPEIITSIIEALAVVDWGAVGSAIITGVFDAIVALLSNTGPLLSACWDLIQGIAKGIWNGFVSLLPSWLLDIFGYGNGIELNAAFSGSSLETAVNDLAAHGINLDEEQTGALYQTMAQSYMDQVLAAAGVSFDQLESGTQDYLTAIMADMVSGESGYSVNDLIGQMAAAVQEDENLAASGTDLGSDFSVGLADGILNNTSAITAAVASVCNMAVSEAQDILDIHSPSRVARNLIGKNFGAGIAQGISDSVSGIESAVSGAGAAAIGAMNSSVNSSNFTVNNNVNATVRSEADIDLLAARLAARNKRIARGYAV